MRLTRRDIGGLIAISGILTSTPGFAAPPKRVAVLDWAIAETMLLLGDNPVALVAASDWDRFVVEPRLPAGIADIGVQQEINFELLAELQPDLILTSPFSQDAEPALNRIAPTRRFVVFEPTPAPLGCARNLTLTLGKLLCREHQAEVLLDHANATLMNCRARLKQLRVPPLVLASFLDSRHVRVYGGAGLYQNVLDSVGLTNGWYGPTNAWGYATVGVEYLATTRNLRLVVFEPIPPDALPMLAQSPLWRDLPFVREGKVSTLPPVLMFGAIPAAMRFANLLTTELERTLA